LGKNDVRIYHKVAGKWKLTHTLCEHLSRVLAIDWAPKTNQIVSASAVNIFKKFSFIFVFYLDLIRIIMHMFGHLKIIFGNLKWLNYNEQVELFVVQNGHLKVLLIEKQWIDLIYFSIENKFAIGSSDKNVAICYYEKDQRFWAAEMIKKKPKSTITCIAWHPNNQLLAVGSCDYRCRFVKSFRKYLFIFFCIEFILLLLKLLMNKHEHRIGEKLQIQENFYMNFNQVYLKRFFFRKNFSYDKFRIGLDS